MELRHLQTLLAIRDRKSFTAAAKALGITQAAVSQHVAGMEESLGVRLFDRRGRKVKLTAAGSKLCRHAERILAMMAQAVEDVQGHTQLVQGVLQIASSTVPAATILPSMLGEFRRQFPNVRPELRVSQSETAIAAVERREVDVGFVGMTPTSKSLNTHTVAEDELVLITSADEPLAKKKSISLKTLATLPLIVREPSSGSYRCLENSLAEHGLTMGDLHVAMETNSNDAIVAAVRAASGVSFVSAALVRDELIAGDVVSIKVRSLRPRRKLYMVTPQDLDGREPLRTFVEYVQASAP